MKSKNKSSSEALTIKIWLFLATIFIIASSYFTYKQTLEENTPAKIQVAEAQSDEPNKQLTNIFGTPIKSIDQNNKGMQEENEMIAISYGLSVFVCGMVLIGFFGYRLLSITSEEEEGPDKD